MVVAGRVAYNEGIACLNNLGTIIGMKVWSIIASIIAALSVASCVTGEGPTDPIGLAKEQWDACDHFPSVDLVEISDTGRVTVRDKQYSTVPAAFSSCMGHIEYRQVFDGRRPASDLIRRAYFSNEALKAKNGMIIGLSGPSKKRGQKFSVGEDIYMVILIESSPRHLDFVFAVSDVSGPVYTYEKSISPTKSTASGTYLAQKIGIPVGGTGEYSVGVKMNGYDMGQYAFTVAKRAG